MARVTLSGADDTSLASPLDPQTFNPANRSPNTGINGGQTTSPGGYTFNPLNPNPEAHLTNAPAQPTNPTMPGPTAPKPPTSFGNPVYDQIAKYFQQNNHTPTQGEVSQWGTNIDPSYMASIAATINRQYAQPAGPATPTTTPTPTTGNGDYAGFGRTWLASGGKTPADLAAFVQAHPEYGATIGGSHGDKVTIGGKTFDSVIASGLGGQGASWNEIGAGGSGGGVFSDPATTEWETLLRQVVGQLMNPRPTGYTPAQLDLQQTQQIDPLERQRQAMHQQVLERAAAHGWGSGSGLIEKATQDVDRQFNQFETQTRAGVANNAIALEDQRNQLNDQRAVQALGIMGQIPALADSRLQLANQTLIPSNPYQLLSLQNQFQNSAQNYQQNQTAQNQAFWTQLGTILGNYFGQR